MQPKARHNHGGKRMHGWQPLAIHAETAPLPAGSWWLDAEHFYVLAKQRAEALHGQQTSTASFTSEVGSKTKARTYADEEKESAA